MTNITNRNPQRDRLNYLNLFHDFENEIVPDLTPHVTNFTNPFRNQQKICVCHFEPQYIFLLTEKKNILDSPGTIMTEKMVWDFENNGKYYTKKLKTKKTRSRTSILALQKTLKTEPFTKIVYMNVDGEYTYTIFNLRSSLLPMSRTAHLGGTIVENNPDGRNPAQCPVVVNDDQPVPQCVAEHQQIIRLTQRKLCNAHL